jgi:hypothetical protein
MNIQRGMLRLWIAISALWVALIGVAFSDQLSEILTAVDPPKGQVAGRGAHPLNYRGLGLSVQ